MNLHSVETYHRKFLHFVMIFKDASKKKGFRYFDASTIFSSFSSLREYFLVTSMGMMGSCAWTVEKKQL